MRVSKCKTHAIRFVKVMKFKDAIKAKSRLFSVLQFLRITAASYTSEKRTQWSVKQREPVIYSDYLC